MSSGLATGRPALQVTIPYRPRRWARSFHDSLVRWFVLVIHRRAGKTTAILNHHQRAALDDGWERRRLLALRSDLTESQLAELVNPPGGRHYGHVMPLRTQAKAVAWDKLKYYAMAVPGVKFNESELLVRYPTGHKLQLFGADNPDSFRGMAFSGLSFDEFGQMVANVFSEVLSKALADHLGYAVFAGTVRGRDQLYETYDSAKGARDWFALWQQIDKTLATEESVTVKLLEQAMADDRRLIEKGLMLQDEFDQEWYLSTEAAIKGAWFAKEMAAALKGERICRVPWDPALLVDTDWDLGVDDATAIWLSQSERSGAVRLINYYEATGEGLGHYVSALRQLSIENGYSYGKHYPPHDIAVRELGTGKSRRETAFSLGLKFEDPLPPLPVIDGINAARLLIPKCWFDEEKCRRGIEALRQYRKSYNAKRDQFTGVPVHDWTSHAADAFRGLAQRHKAPEVEEPRNRPTEFVREFTWG